MTLPIPLIVAAALFASGCSATAAGQPDDDPRMPVTAAFYPLQFTSERVGGTHVRVTSLTKPGAEPHDLELTPKAVGALASSEVVVYLEGFQPAVDEAVATQAARSGYDVSGDAELSLRAGAPDPHFWLDPVRLGRVATALAERFASVDPANSADYRANAVALVTDLQALDDDFRTGLAGCASSDLVTSHAAFGYLADRYGLAQEGVAGIDPDAEPDAATLRDLAAHVRQHGVSTIYSETLVSPALAETLGRETGARVAVLDPLEGITDASAGEDYLEVMRANLATLRAGQECS